MLYAKQSCHIAGEQAIVIIHKAIESILWLQIFARDHSLVEISPSFKYNYNCRKTL